MLQNVIFDLDGTLLDSLDDITASLNKMRESYQLAALTRKDVQALLGYGARNLVKGALPPEFTTERIDEALAFYQADYRIHYNQKTKPYDGILALLQELKALGRSLAVVSNKDDDLVQKLCQEHFPGLLDFALGNNTASPKKPAPDNLLRAMTALGADSETSVYLGDSEVDIKTARNAHVAALAVTWGYRDKAVLAAEKPDWLCDTIEECQQALQI